MSAWQEGRVLELLERHRHMCAFFNSQEEEFRVTLPFMREGLHAGERVLNLLRDRDLTDHPRRLREGGIAVEPLRATGQFVVQRSQEAYFPDGRFDIEGMLDFVRATLSESATSGFPRTRVVAHCECMVQDPATTAAFLEYESRLNYFLPDFPDIAICAFDSHQIGAEIAVEVLRTHPVVILAGRVQENPLYEAPDEFLANFRERLGG